MTLFTWGKDGGQESKVKGFWLIEWKRAFSVVLLRFDGASREAFHTHAFNSISWVLKGRLHEQLLKGVAHIYPAGWKPIITQRTTFHQVNSEGVSWVLSFRGPWVRTWREYLPTTFKYLTLSSGRQEVS